MATISNLQSNQYCWTTPIYVTQFGNTYSFSSSSPSFSPTPGPTDWSIAIPFVPRSEDSHFPTCWKSAYSQGQFGYAYRETYIVLFKFRAFTSALLAKIDRSYILHQRIELKMIWTFQDFSNIFFTLLNKSPLFFICFVAVIIDLLLVADQVKLPII